MAITFGYQEAHLFMVDVHIDSDDTLDYFIEENTTKKPLHLVANDECFPPVCEGWYKQYVCVCAKECVLGVVFERWGAASMCAGVCGQICAVCVLIFVFSQTNRTKNKSVRLSFYSHGMCTGSNTSASTR